MRTFKTKPVTMLVEEMTKGEYEGYDPDDHAGYLVQVVGRPPNRPSHPHFVYWAEKSAFERDCVETKPDNYFTRLVEEQGQNKERLDKLSVFLDQQSKMSTPTIAYEPLRLLFLQQTLMSELDKVLVERIRLAEVEMEK